MAAITTHVDEPTEARAVSRDGTEVAYWITGEGPPLVLVHGTTADHTRWNPLLPYLEPHATVHAVDRRGRGASGDGADYDVAREFEDVAAVIDTIANASGSAVDVLGHSFGGICAFGAAALTANVRSLVLYEPPMDPDAFALPPDVAARLDALLTAGDREAVLEAFIREVVGMPEHEFVRYRALPAWRARVAAAHTIPREATAIPVLDPTQAAAITAPTLLLLGGDSPDRMRSATEAIAAALPDARMAVLDGQQHIAMDLVPQVFAEHVVAFLRDRD